MTTQVKQQAIKHLADDVIAREQQLKTALEAAKTLQARLALAEQERDEFKQHLSRLLAEYQALQAEYDALLADVEAGETPDIVLIPVIGQREIGLYTGMTGADWEEIHHQREAWYADQVGS